MSWTVSIDVPALRGVVSDLNGFVTQARTDRSGVSNAAARACTSASSLSGMFDHIEVVADAAADLDARIELAILVNSDGDGPSFDSPLTYEIPVGHADTGDLARRMLGDELAKLGESIVADGGEDWQVELLAEQLEKWGDNEDVMTATFESLGPDGTIYLTTALGNFVAGGGDHEAAQNAVDGIRNGLETASSAWDDDVAEEFGRDMVDAAVNPDWDVFSGSGTTVALSLLMFDSSYSGPFLTGVADRLDEVERDGEVPPGYWSQRAMSFSGVEWLFPEDAREAAFDPMVSVFGSMADQPGVALDWWDDADRQEYWIKDRTWRHDDFQSLAAVLDSASTHPSHIDPPFDRDGNLRPEAVAAAQLASATINYLPQNGGFGSQKDGGFFGLGQSHSWGGEAAGEHLANIIATYMPAVDDSLRQDRSGLPATGEAWNAFGEPIPLLPYFDSDALATVIQVASRSDEGFAALRTGVSTYSNQQLALAAHDSTPGDSLSSVSEVLGNMAEIEGFFAYNVGGGDISEAKARDERNQAWVDLGKDLAGAVPVPGGQVVGFIAKQGINVTADQVGNAVTGNEGVATGEANQMAQDSFESYLAQSVWALDDAGALPYQQDGADPLPDGPGVENGRLMSADQLDRLSDSEREAAFDNIVDFALSNHGLGAYAIEQDLKGWYQTPFLNYFG
jgi:hypothetical protein